MNNTTSHYVFYLVGAAGVGKTSYLHRLTTGNFLQPQQYSNQINNQINNQNIEPGLIYDANFDTNYGRKHITFVELNNINNLDCNGIIFMFDKTNMNTLNTVSRLMENHSSHINNFVLCGNKSDLRNTQLSLENYLPNIQNRRINYYDISVNSLYNFEKPIISLLQQILNVNNLVFIPNNENAVDF